jgi:hypothetical protein
MLGCPAQCLEYELHTDQYTPNAPDKKTLRRRELMPAPATDALLTQPSCGGGPCSCPSALGSVLGGKYASLWHWRLSHESLGRDPAPMHSVAARRSRQQALAMLAATYPGALRELERLGAPALRGRQIQAMQTLGCAPVWLRVVWDHHTLWHRALAYRRFCCTSGAEPELSAGRARALAGRFASWYERAASQTPWAEQALPSSWQVPQMGAPHQTLRKAVFALLKQRYVMNEPAIARALWGDTTFQTALPGPKQEKKACR